MANQAVLLFSGQGTQKVGMGKDLAAAFPAAARLFEQADAALGFALSEVMFEGPMEELTRTSRCQPALYCHGLALLEVLKELLPGLEIASCSAAVSESDRATGCRHSSLEISACAGLSLGEFTAHAAAGAFDFATGLQLVHQRGSFMEEACAKTRGAMAALLGGDEAAVRALAAECDVDVANLNAPGQIVLSGTVEGIEAVAAKAKDHGIKRAIPLPVAGAYHSRLMAEAQEKLAAVLAGAPLQSPRVPVISNFEAAAVSEPDAIRVALTSQVTGSVRWVESMRLLTGQGHRLFIELGPDATLAGLMGKIDKEARVISIRDSETMQAALAELA